MFFQIAGILFSYAPASDCVERTLEPFAADAKSAQGLPGEPSPAKVTLPAATVERYAQRTLAESPGIGRDLAESFGVMRSVNDAMLLHDGLFLHAAAVEVDGRGYAFCAPSGTGKSTHLRRWAELLGSHMAVINGDRPFLRRVRDTCYLCGSPWTGKEGWGANRVAPLDALVILERACGRRAHMERISGSDALTPLLRQTIRPSDVGQLDAYCAFLDALLAQVPLYRLQCNDDLASARLSYETLAAGGPRS
jgi:hypothetical protein